MVSQPQVNAEQWDLENGEQMSSSPSLALGQEEEISVLSHVPHPQNVCPGGYRGTRPLLGSKEHLSMQTEVKACG